MANHDKRIKEVIPIPQQVSPATRYARLTPLERIELLASVAMCVRAMQAKKGTP